MKNKKNYLAVFLCVFLSVSGFALGGQDASTNISSSGSSDYLFQENFAQNDVTEVRKNYWGEEVGSNDDDEYNYYSIINIGFSAGKRVIYDGTVALLDYYLPESALAVLDRDELRLLRNSIYAKHGMIFQSEDLKTHFQKFRWYNPRRNNVDSFLTEVDRTNIEKILMFENTGPNLNLNIRDLVGGYVALYPVPSWSPEININANNTIEGILGDEDNWEGTYTLEDGFLVVLVTKQYVGSSAYFLNNNWRWPDGVTYNDGTITYRVPIRMVFPVGNLSSMDTPYGAVGRRQIGSVLWFY